MLDKETLIKELNKCSKCGLCATACPIFKQTLNECDCAKGKITMLQGILAGKFKLNDKIVSYLEKCRGCDLCAESCPAGIDIPKIINSIYTAKQYCSLAKK